MATDLEALYQIYKGDQAITPGVYNTVYNLLKSGQTIPGGVTAANLNALYGGATTPPATTDYSPTVTKTSTTTQPPFYEPNYPEKNPYAPVPVASGTSYYDPLTGKVAPAPTGTQVMPGGATPPVYGGPGSVPGSTGGITGTSGGYVPSSSAAGGTAEGGGGAFGSSSWIPYYQTAQASSLNPLAEGRSGLPMETAPDLATVAGRFSLPDMNTIKGNVDASGLVSPEIKDLLTRLTGMKEEEFGIPQTAMERLKVSQASALNPQYEAQKQAARRLMARLGLTDDTAEQRALGDIEQQRLTNIGQTYGNIEAQSALQARQGFIENLNRLLEGRMNQSRLMQEAARLSEGSRQFNVGAGLDVSRLNTAQQQALEDMRMRRTILQESIRNFLENYELQRINMASGLAGQAQEEAAKKASDIMGWLGPVGSGFGKTIGGMG